MAVKRMKRRIFAGNTCEQIVYNVPAGVRDPKTYDPEKPKRQRFKDAEEYDSFKTGISLRTLTRLINANFSPGDWNTCLTFNNEWEVHTFEDARKIRENYVRVLRRKYPDSVIVGVMGRGRGTARIHFHMLIKGIPEDFIKQKWKYGEVVRIEPLREHCWYDGVDHGADYSGIARYMFEHWTPEQGGHRWFQTKNAKQPEVEPATEVRVTGGYSEKRPPVAPKGYKLVTIKTTPYGYLYFKYVAVAQKARRKPKKKTGSRTG